MNINLKKAAMFGLDARIALAIFGALSVISGAALYSAIQQAKVVALVTELSEIGKAAEQYMLDTGQELPVSSEDTLNRHLVIRELLESSVPGWKGPYLSGYRLDGTEERHLLHPKYYRVFLLKISAGGTINGTDSQFLTCTTSVCDIYADILGVPDSIAQAADVYVDGTSGYNTGKVILAKGFSDSNTAINTAVLMKVMPAIDRP